MVLHAADPAGVGHPDDHGQLEGAPRTVMHLGHVADDLFEGRVGEGIELHLDDGPHAVHRHAHGHAHDPGFGQRGVEAALFAEGIHEAVGDAEDTAQAADVLAEDQHRGVVAHGVGHGGVEGLGHSDALGGGAFPTRRGFGDGGCCRGSPGGGGADVAVRLR